MGKWKWLIRIASLLIVLGFFLPAVLVSCDAGYIEPVNNYSLADIAANDTPILYLVPLLSFIALGFSLIQGRNILKDSTAIWAQLITVILQLVIVVMTVISISSRIRSQTFDLVKVKPIFGTYFLILMALFYIFCWINLKRFNPITESSPPPKPNDQQDFPREPVRPPVNDYSPRVSERQSQAPAEGANISNASLVVLNERMGEKRIRVGNDGFTIGRASSNQLHLEDQMVSRNHAVLRFSQGNWFIQDADSSGGTFVNGVQTDAIRLNSGDEIKIGPYKFKFLLD